ncbi:hypothetical protein [Sphingomonas sp. R86521]|uniref:hypothetical protein n=1 Tax=Sphingomonas sp. R86521 TaxID=3093860 RepID=UPI0036D2ED75
MTFDGMARGGAQRVLRKIANDLEAAAVLAERQIEDEETPVEFIKIAEEKWRSNDGQLELRRRRFRQGTDIDLYLDGCHIKKFYTDGEIGAGLGGPETVHVLNIFPEQARTEVGATTYGPILRAYVRAAEPAYHGRPQTVEFDPRRAARLDGSHGT